MSETLPVLKPSPRDPRYQRIIELLVTSAFAAILVLVISQYVSLGPTTVELERNLARLDEAQSHFARAEERANETTVKIATNNASEPRDPVKTESLLTQLQLDLSNLQQADKELFAAEKSVSRADGAQQVVKVFYATDRNAVRDLEAPFYGPERGDSTRYGVCEVTIPRRHKVGSVESPGFWRRLFRRKPNPEKDIFLQDVKEFGESNFYQELHSDLQKVRSPKVFIYIHGFANSFVDAARRTAQLHVDLGYDGVPMMYSWPSRGVISKSAYQYDATNADWSFPRLGGVLQKFSRQSGAEHIDLVAHSMGNDVLARAMAEVPNPTDTRTSFNNVVLTAPDIDLEILRDRLVPAIKRNSARVTLYASSNDRALAYSRSIHGGYRRAGDSEPDILVAVGLDSVDASAVDTDFFSLGHSYFGENRTVLSDLFLVFRDGSPPDRRNLLAKPDAQNPKFWAFRP